MKPDHFLIPENEKIQVFFLSLFKSESERMKVTQIYTEKIWIDEKENTWDIEYTCPVSVGSELLDTLADGIKKQFRLNYVCWSNGKIHTDTAAQTNPGPDRSFPEPQDTACPMMDDSIPLPEEPPEDAFPDEDEEYMQAYNALTDAFSGNHLKRIKLPP